MKKSLIIFAVLMLALTAAGCANNTTPTPSATPKLSASPALTESPAVSESPMISENPGPSGTLPGYEEGKTVKEEEVPEVVAAVKEKYPDETIKSITYATHETEQVYHVTLEAKEGTEARELYVSADGTITPAAANAVTP